MRSVVIASILMFCGCASKPVYHSTPEHRLPRCDRWRAENGAWYVVHEITADSYFDPGPCPCGMETRDGHLYIRGVLSDGAIEGKLGEDY